MNDQINNISDCYATADREGSNSLNIQTDDYDLRGEINVLEAETVWETQQTRDLLRAATNIHIRFVNSTEASQSELRGESSNIQVGLSSTSQIYRSKNHATNLLRQLNQQRREGKNCDLTIRCGSQRATVHKAILAATSQYFCRMIEENTLTTDSPTVLIAALDEGAFRQLLDFIYTGELCLTTETVQNLLVTANILQLQEAEIACWSFIEHRLDSNTCLSIFRLAELMGRSEPVAACLRYIAQHFECIAQDEELPLLSENQFSQLISSETMGKSEDDRLKAIIRWVKHDSASRQHLAPNLLLNVQVTRLSKEYLHYLSEFTDLLAGAPWLTIFLVRALGQRLPSPREPASQPETSTEYTDIIVVAGGWAGSTTVECYDLRNQRWTSSSTNPNTLQQDAHSSPMIPALPREQFGGAAVAADDLLYILGGYDDPKSVDIYDQHHHRWIAGPEMQHPRVYLGAAVLDRKVYAIGGQSGLQCHESAEVLEPRTGVWRTIAPMTCARTNPGVSAFKNCIFAVGGSSSVPTWPLLRSSPDLSTAESYNPHTNEWTRIAQMPIPRGGLGLCVLGDHMYAVGGLAPGGNTAVAEVYSSVTDSWKSIAPMNERRFGFGLVAYDGYLYAIGGYRNSVERYDPAEDKWTILPSRMESNSRFAGVTLFRLKRSG